MPKKISIDSPLSELTLRKYEKPQQLKNRELVRKLCLSLGLLQPGDSRDVMVDVLLILLTKKKPMTSTEVEKAVIAYRKKTKKQLLGIAPSNIRRQLLRLRDLFIVEKVKNNYRIREKSRLSEIFKENIEQYYLNSIIQRVKEYLKEADKRFLK
jgi:DNA-binding transcriptional ArsR family regulator